MGSWEWESPNPRIPNSHKGEGRPVSGALIGRTTVGDCYPLAALRVAAGGALHAPLGELE